MSEQVLREAVAAYEAAGRNKAAAARELGLSRSTLRSRLQLALESDLAEEPRRVEYPEFGDDDTPIEDIIDFQRKRFEKRYMHHRSKEWFPVKVNLDGPIGVTFFGDPHVDDDGCCWPLLLRHCELHRQTEGLFGVNIGDATNNWAGRLVRLYAEQETGRKTAQRLARWFLADSGVTWLCWLMGNHDMWAQGSEILRLMNTTALPMEDWQARFRLVFPKGLEAHIWAAHNFKGHSLWNTLHGPQRAAHTKAEAHLYVCGDTHNWALHQEESASRDFTYWLARCRGYKFIDHYAEQLGHDSQQEGASITAIINPEARSMSDFIHCFADMERAVDYLGYLRRLN